MKKKKMMVRRTVNRSRPLKDPKTDGTVKPDESSSFVMRLQVCLFTPRHLSSAHLLSLTRTHNPLQDGKKNSGHVCSVFEQQHSKPKLFIQINCLL